MASSAKTENVALNQWAATDPVLREDFNADNLIIDRALRQSCKMAYGIFSGCEDMSLSMGSIEVGFVPKVAFLWQSGVENPWYTVAPLMADISTAICARVGLSQSCTLSVSFLNDSVAWAPASGDPDFARGTMYRYLILG